MNDDPVVLVESTESQAKLARRRAAIAGTTDRWRSGAHLVLALAIGMLVAGCYETDEEIITIERAVAIPGLAGEYGGGDGGGGITTITSVPNSNEYRFAETSDEGGTTAGTLRVIPILGGTYLVQARYDGEDTHHLLFYEFNAQSGRNMELLAPDEPVGHLAAQYGVTIEVSEDGADILRGSRSAILDFLLAHRSIRFDHVY